MLETLVLSLLVLVAAGSYGFLRPHGAFRKAAILAAAALCAPFVLGFALAPFLGSGAGMGVAFILFALAAMLLGAALFAAVGAGARYGWERLQPRG